MKQKLSVTVDKRVFQRLEKCSRSPLFRNKSHLVELALSKFLEELDGSTE